MKTGKELKIDKYKNYNIVFGSINNKQSKAVYINISAWAEPQQLEFVNYNRTLKDINKKIRQSLFNYFSREFNSDFNKDKTIVDLDIRESGIKYGKRSFMNCEITLFLNSEIPVNNEKMKYNLDKVINLIIDSVFNNCKLFKFHKKKHK